MQASRSDQSGWTRFITRWLLVGVVVMLVAIATSSGLAQQPELDGNKVDGFPVVLDGNTLFYVRQGVPGVASAEERAQIITRRLNRVANDPSFSVDTFQVEASSNGTVIKAGEVVLFTLQDTDAKILGKTHQETADKAVELVRTAVRNYREQRSLKAVIQGIVYAVLSTIALILCLKVLQRVVSRLLVRVRAARQANALSLHFHDLRLLGSNATSYLLSGLIRLARLVLILTAFSLYLPFFLSQFPTTRVFGKSLLSKIAQQVQLAFDSFAQYLPNLIMIAIIVFITNYVIEFARLVISELGRDDAYHWFYPEWIKPTSRLVNVCIIAIACVVAAPYLPGFGSPAFQGVSIFLGALVTLGSSSAISNAIAGIILIYTRAFRIGDIIRIGEVTGKVLEKSLFVTRIASFRQEIIVLPNAAVLNGNVMNFSLVQRETGEHLALHTTVTLGYDIPWKKIDEVLVKAAIATPNILAEPSPFVLQTSLNDFHVSYQINAFTDRPDLMPIIYTKLHQNIQDYCNAAGIEIMSPGYTALRDGNHSTMPSDYLPPDYEVPAFQVRTQNGNRPT
ncbi:small-conductance mechanosensitive channel [Leptolyngbyaceae cyanobacterium JSC-12]|nr:small-conductance mechanosensitive channel [Leptolyngbyaceae cyanobacterium JSC-12]